MAQIKYIDANNIETEIDIEAGENVMSLAVNNIIDGIEGECGGVMACATCHCYVDEEYAQHFSPADEMEQAMLEMVADRRETSRLGCQLILTDDMPDITITLPESQ